MSSTDSNREFYHPVRIGRIIGSLETAIFTYNSLHRNQNNADLIAVTTTDPLRQILSAAMSAYETMLSDYPDSHKSVPGYLHGQYEQMNRLFNSQDK